MDLTDNEHLEVIRAFRECTEEYFEKHIGMASELGIKRAIDYDNYEPDDILVIAFKKAMSIETAEKLLYIWGSMDLSSLYGLHQIYSTLHNLSSEDTYEKIVNVLKERKANEEKNKISSNVTVEKIEERKKRI